MAEAAVTGRLSSQAQVSLIAYCKIVLDLHQRTQELRDKMEFIDIAYARYKYESQNTGNGEDTQAGQTACGVDTDDITVPIVVSQVDSYVGYFADIFLTGFPIFPVISTADHMIEAEKLQAIIDDHAIRGRYPRHLLMSLRDDVKYNFSAIEIDWCPLDAYTASTSYDQVTGSDKAAKASKLTSQQYYINKLKRLDPYNTIYDDRVYPVDVPYHGEYAGYIEVISRVELKRRLAYFATTGDGYHTSQAYKSSLGTAPTASAAHMGYYTQPPQISNILVRRDIAAGGLLDWVSYLTGQKGNRYNQMSDMYEFVTLYVRLIPEEHSMDVPRKGSPQVWKLCFVNHEKLVYAKRIYSLYDMIPIIFSQVFEDGFTTQTESLGERGIPFQEAASKLFSIRLNSARRAVMDRAIYDPLVINKDDVNAPFPAAKIPIKPNSLLGGKTLEQSYRAIPFDERGTENVVQDMQHVMRMADSVNGLNQPLQGQFQRGNKTRKEWTDTMEGATNRLRLPALSLEYQKFLPLKEQIKLNIYQYGIEGPFQNMRTGTVYKITAADLNAIKEKIGNFEMADGYHPVEKMAATDVLTGGMQLIGQSQVLQASWGQALPRMFAHLMQLGGVKGIDKYIPQQAPQQAPPGPPGAPGAPATPASVVPGPQAPPVTPT